MRGRGAADRAEPGRYRLRTAAWPVDALPAHGGGGPGDTAPRAAEGAAARPVADPLRRAGPGPRLLPPPRHDRPAGPALGDRAVHAGGPAPGGAAGLDRPGGRRRGADRRTGRPAGRTGTRRRRPAAVPARGPGHRPGLRQQAARARDRALRPRPHRARRRGGRPGGRRTARRAHRRRAGDPHPGREPYAAHLGHGVAGPGPAAGAARRGACRGPLDPRPLVVHVPPRPHPVRRAPAAAPGRRGDRGEQARHARAGTGPAGGPGGAGRSAGDGRAATGRRGVRRGGHRRRHGVQREQAAQSAPAGHHPHGRPPAPG